MTRMNLQTTKRAKKPAGRGAGGGRGRGGGRGNAGTAGAGGKTSGGPTTGGDGKDAEDNDAEENEEENEEMIDGEDLDHRRRDDDESLERMRDEDRTRMLELLKTFTPSQMERYECYRRSNLSKPMLRKLFKAASGVTLNANGLIILAGISKMFVGEMVEKARDIMKAKGLNEYEEIQPEHLRAAAAEIDAKDGLMRRRTKTLFRRGYC